MLQRKKERERERERENSILVVFSFFLSYFCGHDHDIQHIKEDGSNVNYFVSGAGHHTDFSTANEVSSSCCYKYQSHYCVFYGAWLYWMPICLVIILFG